MPYRNRTEVETVRFPLRTPPLYRVGTFVVAVLALLSAGVLLFGHGMFTLPAMLTTVALTVFFIGIWATTEPYRIGGGRGELVVDGDMLAVPGARRGEVVRMALSGLAFQRVPVTVRFSLLAGAVPVGTVQRGEIIILRNGATQRALSTLTSADARFADELFALLVERSLPAPERERLDAMFQEAARMLAENGIRTRVGASPPPLEDDAELERRIDEALLSEKE